MKESPFVTVLNHLLALFCRNGYGELKIATIYISYLIIIMFLYLFHYRQGFLPS